MFIKIKQEQEKEELDQPNPKTEVQLNRHERMDMILVKDVDKLTEKITLKYSLKMDDFASFFQTRYSLVQTSFVITIAEYVEILLEYVQD